MLGKCLWDVERVSVLGFELYVFIRISYLIDWLIMLDDAILLLLF